MYKHASGIYVCNSAMLHLDIVSDIYSCIPSKLSFAFCSKDSAGVKSTFYMNYNVHVPFSSMHSPNEKISLCGRYFMSGILTSHLMSW